MNKLAVRLQMPAVFDGTTASVTFDLTKPPVSLNLNGNHPSGVQVITTPPGSTSGTATLTHGSDVTLTYSPTPSAGNQSVDFFVEFDA
jgi:hypothetical protein